MLRAYMVSDGHPYEAACIVFAHTAREARKVGWATIHSWTSCNFIQVKAKWLSDSEHIFAQADREKLVLGKSHVVECPMVCSNCQQWGYVLDADGYCEGCAEAIRASIPADILAGATMANIEESMREEV